MPDLPWTSQGELESDRGYLAMASFLPLSKFSSTPVFLRGVLGVRGQLASADGLIGYMLRARLLARDYWTLSVWRDAPALQAFLRALPHAELMTSLRPVMGSTTFVQWEIAGSDGRPEWPDALRRLTAKQTT